MNVLKAMNFNGTAVVDSRQIAEAVEKKHKNLLRDIAKYCNYLTELKIEPSDFFIESTYIDPTGRTLPCYLCTQKGCEMIAHKLTSKKGVIFTALYINAFHEMRQQKCIDCRIFEKLEDIKRKILLKKGLTKNLLCDTIVIVKEQLNTHKRLNFVLLLYHYSIRI